MVGTVVAGVDVRAFGSEQLFELRADRLVVSLRELAACNARLVGNNYNRDLRIVEPFHRCRGSRDEAHLFR